MVNNKVQQPEVRCHHCNWAGEESSLKIIYIPSPKRTATTVPAFACPACLQADQLEYRREMIDD